jgi:hypothetical protein
MEKTPKEEENSDDSGDINDQLTIEGMLQVLDTQNGQQLDVRRMLNIKNKDIKDPNLRAEISNYSIVDSTKQGANAQSETKDMGAYIDQLDFIEFDMGKFKEDDEEETKQSFGRKTNKGKDAEVKSAAWKDWWEYKHIQNEKLKNAILDNDLPKVQKYLTDDELVAQGFQADVNCKLEFNGFKLTPLLMAI